MKTFDPQRDIVNLQSSVEEVITFGGSLFTSSAGQVNIKRYFHWTSGSASGSFYQGIFNTNHSASTAIELLDLTYGQSVSSSYYSHPSASNKAEKLRIYRLFAKRLLGSESSLFTIGGISRNELVFLNVRRSQFKDEIKKGTTSLVMMFSGSGSTAPSQFDVRNFNDVAAATSFSITNRGEVGNLVTGSTTVGQIYYQAGIMVLVPELVSNTSSVSTNPGNTWSGSFDYEALVVSGGNSSINGNFEAILNGVRYRFKNVSFVNRSKLHATFYYCRALNDEFNYSSNPTFTDSSGRIIPTSGSTNLSTRTYITKVAIFGENGEILAVGGTSEPIKKSPENEVSIKVRLDYGFALLPALIFISYLDPNMAIFSTIIGVLAIISQSKVFQKIKMWFRKFISKK